MKAGKEGAFLPGECWGKEIWSEGIRPSTDNILRNGIVGGKIKSPRRVSVLDHRQIKRVTHDLEACKRRNK